MDSGEEDEAMFDDLEERLAALHPEARFDIPEELNDLSPEERSWLHDLAHHVGHAAISYALGRI